MGKNGRMMREAKKAGAVYSFTREQLEERDKRLLLEHEERLKEKTALAVDKEWKEREERFKEVIEEEWSKREELFASPDAESNLIEFTRLAMMIPLRILVEEFGWQPAKEARNKIPDGRFKIVRLHDLCAMAINDIVGDELKDIRSYSAECEKITGVDFRLKEEGGWE